MTPEKRAEYAKIYEDKAAETTGALSQAWTALALHMKLTGSDASETRAIRHEQIAIIEQYGCFLDSDNYVKEKK